MITVEMTENAKDFIGRHWGEAGQKVIAEAQKAKTKEMTCKEFLTHCTACGGNWGGMLLTGIKELWPDVWEAIPDDMGIGVWECLCNTLILCGVDTAG